MAITVHLQGVGDVPAKTAGEIQVGDKLLYNYRYEYTVTAVRYVTKCLIEIDETNPTGRSFTRRLKKTRLVALA
jgi:hypothetical protein